MTTCLLFLGLAVALSVHLRVGVLNEDPRTALILCLIRMATLKNSTLARILDKLTPSYTFLWPKSGD